MSGAVPGYLRGIVHSWPHCAHQRRQSATPRSDSLGPWPALAIPQQGQTVAERSGDDITDRVGLVILTTQPIHPARNGLSRLGQPAVPAFRKICGWRTCRWRLSSPNTATNSSVLVERGWQRDRPRHPLNTEIDYGVPLLLIQLGTAISAEDFRTLNQCLDDAIAGAVTEFAKEQDSGRDGELSELGRRWCHRRSGPPQLCVFARVCGSSRSGCLTNGCFLCRPLRS